MRYNLLVVTDHTTHAASNSLYELAKAMFHDPRMKNIWVGSRGHYQNKDFFGSVGAAEIFGTPVTSRFSFDIKGSSLLETVIKVDDQVIDAVFIRMPQPLDKEFLLSLSRRWPEAVIINDPAGTIETSSKEFLLQIPHLCPPMQMCHSADEAIEISKQKEIVLKPLYSYGGRDIARISRDNFWWGPERHPVDMIYQFLTPDHFPMLAMDYLSNVSQGDKRTIVVNKKVIGSALRMPPPESWICNIAQGGHALISAADENELRIEQEITPLLYDKGVIMYGFDTLVNDEGKRVLSEINTLSIGGLGPIEELSGLPVLKTVSSLLCDYIEEKKSTTGKVIYGID